MTATIGLLGGMSWPSTITYYREINRAVAARLGGSHSARILIWSSDYADVERMQLTEDWTAAGDWLADGAVQLERAGAELIGIACNTMHQVAHAVRARCGLPLVDLVAAAARAAAVAGLTRVAVLGTRFTAGMPSFREHLRAHGIDQAHIAPETQQRLDRIVYDELCLGRVTDHARDQLQEIIAGLADLGCDGVLLACTEFNLLVPGAELAGLRVIDTVEEHVRALVDASIGADTAVRT